MDKSDLQNKAASAPVALVTGAGRRLGRVIALTMAERGWDVAIHYRHSTNEAEQVVDEIRKLGRRAHAFQADLAQEAQAQALIPRILAHFARLDCVVNSASLFEYDDAASFNQVTLDAHMHANLMGPIILSQALHAATPEGGQGVVINLLDQKLYNMNPDFLSYTLSKAALESATTMLAQSLAPKLRVVGLAPGITLISGAQSEADFARSHRMTPLGYSSRPEDIAEGVCYLAQARAITGTTLVIDGGQHLIPLQRDVAFIPK
ncbi:SDR family oxidoreductase [Massilia sp. W12]|uniref:SDR family oxidoreductase n=1 Tax=Massilia sp. W12 TaxID=3126507 RepID=UPI0030CA842E